MMGETLDWIVNSRSNLICWCAPLSKGIKYHSTINSACLIILLHDMHQLQIDQDWTRVGWSWSGGCSIQMQVARDLGYTMSWVSFIICGPKIWERPLSLQWSHLEANHRAKTRATTHGLDFIIIHYSTLTQLSTQCKPLWCMQLLQWRQLQLTIHIIL